MSGYLGQFKREHLKEYLEIALQAFKNNNPEFLLGLISHQKFLKETETQILLLLELEQKFNKENNTKIMFNNVHFQNGKMVVAGFACDLHYYIKYATGKINDELLKQLSSIDLATVPKNSAFVAMKVAVHKEWQNKGVGERALYEKSVHMLNNGYKTEYSLMINPFSLKILQKFGTKLWKDVSIMVKDKKLNRIIVQRDIKVIVGGIKPKL